MSHSHGHALHVGYPVLHRHSPHLEWHEIEHPLRAALVASALLAVAMVGISARGLPALPSLASLLPAAAPAVQAPRGPIRDLPREWRYEIPAVDLGRMVAPNARGPDVDQMFRTRF